MKTDLAKAKSLITRYKGKDKNKVAKGLCGLLDVWRYRDKDIEFINFSDILDSIAWYLRLLDNP